LCAQLLKGSGVKVCTVIGFPLGANDPEVKAFEAAKAVENGADEVDMVRIAFGLVWGSNTITLQCKWFNINDDNEPLGTVGSCATPAVPTI
jgi:deoxyribose-phosphate aldolase